MQHGQRIHFVFLVGCSAFSAIGQQAIAQTVQGASSINQVPTTDQESEALVVTGSRISRDGFQSPTPMSVFSSELLDQQTVTSNIADTLRRIPIFTGGTEPRFSAGTPSSGNAGINSIALRALSANRTLVLIDGRRVAQTLPDGTVDINYFPQQLIRQVDVVSGGASAVYGSDAVAGVVNFILDRKFTGFKGEFSGGATGSGENVNGRFNFALGKPFAGGRGHFLLSGDLVYEQGIYRQPGGWNDGGTGIMQNPAYTATNGLPEQLLRDDVGPSNATHGGLIISFRM
jgi:outer membrane receptor for ferrienterochelin and colicin